MYILDHLIIHYIEKSQQNWLFIKAFRKRPSQSPILVCSFCSKCIQLKNHRKKYFFQKSLNTIIILHVASKNEANKTDFLLLSKIGLW